MTFISRSCFSPQYECCRTLGKSREQAKPGRLVISAARGPVRLSLPPPSPVPSTSHAVTDASNNSSVSFYRGRIMIIPRTSDRLPGRQIPPDESGRTDRIRAEPASDPVHRPLGITP
jgi:hypothetical protein